MKMVSNQIAEKPEDMIPYDYVCLANEADKEIFDKLENECHSEMISFPMLRISSPDNTEAPNDIRQNVYPQGQNIGISESTYQELKKISGEIPKNDLKLDAAGENIYIVYQQDKGVRAQPIDWYLGMKTPFIHIGQPARYHNFYKRKAVYPPRNIVGGETGSLIGSFRQGAYENLVVFSDEYFEKAEEFWKTTDIYTGEQLTADEAVIDETIHQGPTRLKLLKVPPKYQKRADQILEEFKEKHIYDDSFNPLVKSVYSKSEEVQQRKMQRLMEVTANGLIVVILLVVSIFLLYMKVKMEEQEMRTRYRFMECFGMRQEERIQAEKREISRFVWLPLVLTVPIVFVFTAITFYLRQFSVADVLHYAVYASVVVIVYVAIQIVNLKYLQNSVTRKVEENIER